jgi:putative nucleotidyltransferase with HDIG domain
MRNRLKKGKIKKSEKPNDKPFRSTTSLKELYDKKNLHKWFIYIIFYLTLFFIFVSPFLSRAIKKYRPGDISEENLVSTRSLKLVDKRETKKKRDFKSASIPPFVDFDLRTVNEDISVAKGVFSKLKSGYSGEVFKKVNEYLRENNRASLSEEDVRELTKYKASGNIEQITSAFISSLLESGIFEGDTSELVRRDGSYVNVRQIQTATSGEREDNYIKLKFDKILKYPLQIGDLLKRAGEIFQNVRPEILNPVCILASSVVKPNITVNKILTEQNRNQILSKIEPVYIIINKGDVILEKGKPVTRKALKKLRYYRSVIKQKAFSIFSIVGVLLFLILFCALIVLFLNLTHPKEMASFRNFILIYFFIIANAVILYVVFKSVSTSSDILISLLIPIGITSICLSILINSATAMSVNFILTFVFLIGLLLTGRENFIAIFIFLCSGGIASYAVKNIKTRPTIFRSGLYIGISNLILISAYALIYEVDAKLWTKNAGFSLLNGIVCSIVSLGIMPFFENVLKIPTSFKLMELADLNVPVLKEMLIEAPGTYHHSLMVANLAEAASEAIGANALLARVGAIYHDLGKLENPNYFVENQLHGDNPHDKLQPSLSGSIIKKHVKNGIERALKLKLPLEIIDFIEQHHGTSGIRFFYEKAKALALQKPEGSENEVDIADYCYEGPKPKSKETAIVMLADSVEAASKTLQSPSSSRIQQLINEIIGNKFLEGELSESDLTLNDLRKISFAFYRILAGVFHTRIEYPNMPSGAQIFDEREKDENKN